MVAMRLGNRFTYISLASRDPKIEPISRLPLIYSMIMTGLVFLTPEVVCTIQISGESEA
jgi:hypothetical protein